MKKILALLILSVFFAGSTLNAEEKKPNLESMLYSGFKTIKKFLKFHIPFIKIHMWEAKHHGKYVVGKFCPVSCVCVYPIVIIDSCHGDVCFNDDDFLHKVLKVFI